MEFVQQFVDIFLHLDVHLNQWAGWMGPWLYVVLFAVVFCETGLVVTPFLPGDSLLFAVGALAASPDSSLSLPLLLGLLCVAAILGDAVNYSIGYWLGPKVFKYENSWFFNKKHLERTQHFYEKYGSKTIVLARFIPIIRTFAPFVAGIGQMQYRRFAVYNVAGGVVWVLAFTLAGYRFAEAPVVKDHFHLVIVAIIVLSIMPPIIEYVLSRRRKKSDAVAAAALSEEIPV
jgi:membrane-associated protein